MNKILKKKKELVLVRKIKKISDIPEYLSFLLKSYDFEDNILDLYYLVEDDGNYIYSETNDYSFSRKDILLTVFGGKIFGEQVKIFSRSNDFYITQKEFNKIFGI